ncbi:CBO0543 family protein [Paenibacillus alba]|uniref:VanZ family protein n=1 Tax=Paenibacillus alba TaxID=1197127 RepID=A0ABU6FYV3_9BACL|nr:CBO0543 family protein [Paenibacillus alba]MEC0227093.1 hypothetical protein [Paenibacillus alba]
MTVERAILIWVWVLCIVLIPILIPKRRSREAILLFLANQLLTWILSVMFVEWGLLENPIREFPAASGSNFTNNYLLFPFLSTLFSLYYPNHKSFGLQVLYQIMFVLGGGIYIACISKYTELLRYIHLNVYLQMLVTLIVINMTRLYGIWFFQKKTHQER